VTTTTADVLVIGGGPAGAAAAARLAAQGLRVVLCERQAEPRQVCGEFVSAAAAAELVELGVEPARLGACAVTRIRTFANGSDVTARLPFAGYGLSRAGLDRSLMEMAARRGAEVRTGIGVRTIERTHGVWSAALSTGEKVESGAVILATGKHDLRGHPRTPGGATPMIGFKMHCRLRPDQAAALGGTVELFLYDGGYAGLQLIETGAVNLCLVIASESVRGRGNAWAAALSHLRSLAPALDARLRGGRWLWPRPVSVARIPYGYSCPADGPGGLYRVGDQAAVIPSFAGEGIAIALRSARLAADAVRAGRTADRYVAAVRRDVGGPMRRAAMVEAASRHRLLRAIGLGVGPVPGAIPLIARLTRLTMPPQRHAP
jgi:flavin-dependent dehydrogenase